MRKLEREFGVSAGGRPAGGDLLDAIVRPLLARRQLVLQPIKLLEVLEGEVGHGLEVALLVFEVVERRLGFFDAGGRRSARLGGRRGGPEWLAAAGGTALSSGAAAANPIGWPQRMPAISQNCPDSAKLLLRRSPRKESAGPDSIPAF